MAEQSRKTEKINLLVTSDIHGYIYPTNYKDKDRHPLGLSRIANLAKQKRAGDGHVLLLDNGDAIQGSPSSYYHATYQKERPNPVIEAMNYMKYDAAAIGNHEFSFGMEYFQKAAAQSEFPWLSANIIKQQDQLPAFSTPYIIKEVNGIRIAVLGITTHFLSNWETPEHLEGIQIEKPVEAAKRWVEYIRNNESPDVLIVSYHGGIERDLQTGIATEPPTGENQAYQICREINEIDVLITGHQHRTVKAEIDGVTVIQPGSFGQVLGEIEITMEETENGWTIKKKQPSLTVVSEKHEPDRALMELVANQEQEVENWLDQSIGTAEDGLRIEDPFHARLKEHPFIELVNKVQMHASGADISCTALFDNKSPGLSGDIAIRDVVANYPYPNSLKVKRLSGYDIKEALEKAATYFHVTYSNEIEINPDYLDPKERPYIYDMWEGIHYEINISNPVGSRITQLEHRGRPILYDHQYEVVMNNYRAGGGGDYKIFTNKPVIRTISKTMVELLINYIREHTPVKAECNHNWRVVKKNPVV